jgi:DNA-directed RNA polymerase subunit RPC12/RpoP
MGNPIAVMGAAITESSPDSTFMRYIPVCMKCGYTGGEITTHGPQGSSASFETDFRCPTCSNRQVVKFIGT